MGLFFAAWKKERSAIERLRWTLLGVASLVRLPFLIYAQAVLWPDSRLYYHEAVSLMKNPASFSHEVFHTPLYPMFMQMAFRLMPDHPVFALIVLQRLLGIGIVALVFETLRRVMTPGLAFTTALITALSPLLLYYEAVVQTEVLFFFVFWLLLLTSLRWFEEPESLLAAANTGLLLAMAALARPIAQLFPLCVLGALLFIPVSIKRRLLGVAVMTTCFAAAVLPWMLENRQSLGFFGISKGGGLNLYLKVFNLENMPPPVSTREPEVAELYRALHSDTKHEYFTVFRSLQRVHSATTADSMMFRFALEAIREDPMRFLSRMAFDTFALVLDPHISDKFCQLKGHTVFCADPTRPYPQAFGIFHEPRPSSPAFLETLVRFSFAVGERISWLLLCLGLFTLPVALWLGRAGWRLSPAIHASKALLAGSFLYFALTSAALNKPEERYRLPVDPILVSFAVQSLAGAGTWGKRRIA